MDGKVFQYPLLGLLEAIVIFIKDNLSSYNILGIFCSIFPWHTYEPIDVIAHNCCFSGHGRHHLEAAQLLDSLFVHCLRHPGLFDLFLELLQLSLGIVLLAQFLLNGSHLLIKVVLFLGSLHLPLYPAADLSFDLKYLYL